MKTAFWIIALIIICGYIADTKITFYPFKIQILSPYMLIAWVLLILSLTFFSMHYRIEGKKELLKEQNERMKEQLKDLKA